MPIGRRYFTAFLITIGVFAIAFLLSNFLYRERVDQVQDIEARINRNMVEAEVQYALLSDVSCDDKDATTLLAEEMDTIGTRLSSMESSRGTTDAEVVALKKYYSLLEVKDYLLLRERARICKSAPQTVLYFYSNTDGNCTKCADTGIILTELRREHPEVRVYAFDYDLDAPIIATLKTLYHLDGRLPALVIDRKPHYDVTTKAGVFALFPGLTTASSTKATTTSIKAKK